MDIDDLRSYLVIARHANLRVAAQELHQTPSALSKTLKRLEESLATPLFDRAGKSLRLNPAGQHLVERAQALVSLADETAAEFHQLKAPARCRLLGPSILHCGFGAQLVDRLRGEGADVQVSFVSCFEDAAMNLLSRGEGDLALVTSSALAHATPARVASVPLGEVRMQLAAGPGHPLSGRAKVPVADVLAHDFACVDRSPFCGLERGGRSDGWRDDQFPRRIRYWLEDLQLLFTLVERGAALAYVPDYAFSLHPGLVRLKVSGCPYECVEQVHLAYRAGAEARWPMLLKPRARQARSASATSR